MAAKPKLSICVPSRNRQFYFQKTIEGMCRNRRLDVEFVFADNSDDPSIMNDYMASAPRDPRIVYLPSGDRTYSMMENWERTVAASTGDWVTVIGDDDHCEADVIDAIARCQHQLPDLEAFTWSCVLYTWATPEAPSPNVSIPFHQMVVQVSPALAFDRMFCWEDAYAVPISGFSIYHSAISRVLLDRIRTRYGGTYFTHPNVDYDMAMKVIHSGNRFVFCQRPYSVMGSCPASNSFAVSRPKETARKNAIFTKESGRNIDEDEAVRDFPFKIDVGTTAAIALTQQWFKKTFNVNPKDWEINFAKACAANTEIFGEIDDFEASKARYTQAFELWHGGQFLQYYKPERKPQGQRLMVTGFTTDSVYIEPAQCDIDTPAKLFDIVNAISPPAAQLDIDLHNPTRQMISTHEHAEMMRQPA